MTSDHECAVCRNVAGNRVHPAREMMFGRRELFSYLECGNCGCLQLLHPPADMSPYYPSDYYSFKPPGARTDAASVLLRLWAASALNGRGWLDRALSIPGGRPRAVEWARRAGTRLDSRILDVGSGGGQLLVRMNQSGFTNLLGVDPFIQTDVDVAAGVRILKRDLSDVQGSFDLVMLHHSFEHMDKPHAVMAHLRRLVAPGGCLLIRTPVIGYAWRHYQTDWVQLDPPRHLIVQSQTSMRLLAEEAGFWVDESQTLFDSTDFQFWASEQYRRDIPLHDDRSYARGLSQSIFDKAEIARFQEQAAELNAKRDGDSAGFFLRLS